MKKIALITGITGQDGAYLAGFLLNKDYIVKLAFAEIGVELEFVGIGIDEKAFVKSCSNEKYKLEIGKEVLAIDQRYFRPTEVDLLIGDASKAKHKLGWIPEYNLKDLVKEIVGFNGRFSWSSDEMNGTPKKCMDVSLMNSLISFQAMTLEEGIRLNYSNYING